MVMAMMIMTMVMVMTTMMMITMTMMIMTMVMMTMVMVDSFFLHLLIDQVRVVAVGEGGLHLDHLTSHLRKRRVGW